MIGVDKVFMALVRNFIARAGGDPDLSHRRVRLLYLRGVTERTEPTNLFSTLLRVFESINMFTRGRVQAGK